jgi:hypothetical protein
MGEIDAGDQQALVSFQSLAQAATLRKASWRVWLIGLRCAGMSWGHGALKHTLRGRVLRLSGHIGALV